MDGDFRDFAARLFNILPGLPFFVFGGSSPQARDLFFGLLANVSAVSNAADLVRVQFSLEEAHALLQPQFEALLTLGIPESAAVEQFYLLAAQLSMTSAAPLYARGEMDTRKAQNLGSKNILFRGLRCAVAGPELTRRSSDTFTLFRPSL